LESDSNDVPDGYIPELDDTPEDDDSEFDNSNQDISESEMEEFIVNLLDKNI
jgi:hypothetical protein